MNPDQQKLATLLAYAGLLPLVFALANQFLRVVPIDSLSSHRSSAVSIGRCSCSLPNAARSTCC
jgi:hypothetical protein